MQYGWRLRKTINYQDYRLCTSIQHQGNASAQVNLGSLYLTGKGVPKDYLMAQYWLRLAANQENALAQAKLGTMYELGQGVQQDFVKAYMWFNLAAANGEKRGAKFRDYLAKQMTPAEIAEAEKLAREWKPIKN